MTNIRIEESIVLVLTLLGRGMTTEQITKEINDKRLHTKRDGEPVSIAQVYAAVKRNPSVFSIEGGLIHLVM